MAIQGTVSSNAEQLALRMEERARLFPALAERAMQENLKAAEAKAVEYSSVKAYNPKVDKSRPYSRVAPHPPLPPYYVNVQSGTFQRSWRTEQTRQEDGIRGSIYNMAPQSRFFNGPPRGRMIGRPILQQVMAKSRPGIVERFSGAVRSALRRIG